MKKEEYRNITTEVIDNILTDMKKEGISGMSAVAATLTMTMFASKLGDSLFDDNEEIEIER